MTERASTALAGFEARKPAKASDETVGVGADERDGSPLTAQPCELNIAKCQ